HAVPILLRRRVRRGRWFWWLGRSAWWLGPRLGRRAGSFRRLGRSTRRLGRWACRRTRTGCVDGAEHIADRDILAGLLFNMLQHSWLLGHDLHVDFVGLKLDQRLTPRDRLSYLFKPP